MHTCHSDNQTAAAVVLVVALLLLLVVVSVHDVVDGN